MGKRITPEAAARLLCDGDTLATGGFVGIGVAEELLLALERRFKQTGSPHNLTVLFAAGQGDGATRGLNHLAHPGLVRRAIGGHWGVAPALGRLALAGDIDAYSLPQGVISQLFREIAAGRPGLVTKIGLGTFVDPRLDGGRLNAATSEPIVHLLEVFGEEHLFFPSRRVDVAFLRGTTADADGNVTTEHEAMTLDSLAIAQATKNSGGTVIVQVERTTTHHHTPNAVRIPGILVDHVVVAGAANHMQTFAEGYNPAYSGEVRLEAAEISPLALDARKVIARRALQELRPGAVVNLGSGIPEGIVAAAAEEGMLDRFTLTVEAGGIGGLPAGGLSFGAEANAAAIVDQPAQFDFYDGGGLDQAFLGAAEIDRHGNVNASRFGARLMGAGGFINISQSARAVYFMGTFAVGDDSEVAGGTLRVTRPGRPKLVADAGHITFSGERARADGREVLYITERCVLRLEPDGLELAELAPGLDLERDVLAQMGFRPRISPALRQMRPALFRAEPMRTVARAA